MHGKVSDLEPPIKLKEIALFCEDILPRYDEEITNPLEAIEVGAGNCAVRAFVIATVAAERDIEHPSIFVHRGPKPEEAVYGAPPLRHAIAICDGTSFDTTNPRFIKLIPVKSDCSLYREGLLICGDPEYGLEEYVGLNPSLPKISKTDVQEAKRQIIGSL